uniref:Uncharacterized protein n=1 Tax=Brassica oleracea var. oleracea TaxID=109376 RepID=A0A0D3AZT5_BRAOL
MAKIRSIRSKMNFCLLLSLPLILIFFIMILILGLKCSRSRQNRKPISDQRYCGTRPCLALSEPKSILVNTMRSCLNFKNMRASF